MTTWGRAMYVTPGVVVDGKLVTNDLVEDQPRHPDPARQLLLQGVAGPGDVRHERPAGQPGVQGPSVEPAHDPGAAEARLRRQVQLGDEPALVPRGRARRQHLALDTGGGPLARLWSTALSGLVDIGYVKATGQQRPDQLPADGAPAREVVRVADPDQGATPSSAIGRAPTSRRTPRAARCTSSRRRSRRSARGTPRRGASSRSPTRRIGCGFTEAVRGVLSHHMVIRGGKIANYHPYPPTPWNANPRDKFGTPGPVRGRRPGPADLRGERPGELQGHRHHAHGPQLRPVPAVRRPHVPRRRARCWSGTTRRRCSSRHDRRGPGGAVGGRRHRSPRRTRPARTTTRARRSTRASSPSGSTGSWASSGAARTPGPSSARRTSSAC